MHLSRPTYIGRFAPSPTGDLHFGSLVAAAASFLQARARHGIWLVRIEDIDPPREVGGSAARILADLLRLGMQPDAPVLYQSTRSSAYRAAWEGLLRRGLAYHCRCSRKQLPSSGVYPGTCRTLELADAGLKRTRFRVAEKRIAFHDRVMGSHAQDLEKQVGDFVIRRADGLPAYHLAVVLDDALQRVTEVVRGIDLIDSTPRQIALQRALGLPTPGYLHVPLAVNPDGTKLSKRTGSDPLRISRPEAAVAAALEFLGHPPPADLPLDRLWAWAIAHWDPNRIPRQRHSPLPQAVLSA